MRWARGSHGTPRLPLYRGWMDRRLAVAGGVLGLALVAGVAGAAMTAPEDPVDRADQRASAASPTPSPSATPTGPPVLLPNLRSTGARDIQVERVGTVRRLRFTSYLANLGPGPLVLLPGARGRCEVGQHSARQLAFVDRDGDAAYVRGRDRARTQEFAGCMLRHRGHDHWHFDAMAAYSLRRPRTGDVAVSRDKVSFCLRDNRRVAGVRTTVRREHFGDCTATTGQGISPGWVDVYSADLDGQWLRLPAGGPQTLCLNLVADPKDLVEEADEGDNGTSVALRVRGTVVRRIAPAVCR